MIDDPRFAAAPTFGKLAVAGRWEDAVTFHPSMSGWQEQIPDLLAGAEEVACEAFFGSAFFGVRSHGPDPVRFVMSFAEAMRQAADGPAFFAAIEGMGVNLEQDFAFAELGAEGAWQSVGPLRIAEPCTIDVPALWEQLLVSRVGRDTTHAKALEFTFTGGLTHWFALPVSDDAALSRDMLVDALRTYCA